METDRHDRMSSKLAEIKEKLSRKKDSIPNSTMTIKNCFRCFHHCFFVSFTWVQTWAYEKCIQLAVFNNNVVIFNMHKENTKKNSK